MRFFKKSLFFAFFLFFATILNGQSIFFQFKDGSNAEYQISAIRNIVFDHDTMRVNMRNGSKSSLSLNQIGRYKFNNIMTTVNPFDQVLFNQLQVYPNPSNGNLTINYNCIQPGIVTIEVMNQEGEVVKTFEENQSQAGDFSITWNGRDHSENEVPSGLYICKITSAKNSTTQKVLISKE